MLPRFLVYFELAAISMLFVVCALPFCRGSQSIPTSYGIWYTWVISSLFINTGASLSAVLLLRDD